MRNYMQVLMRVCFSMWGGGSVFPKRTKTIGNVMNDLFFNQWGVGWVWGAGVGAQVPARALAQGHTHNKYTFLLFITMFPM